MGKNEIGDLENPVPNSSKKITEALNWAQEYIEEKTGQKIPPFSVPGLDKGTPDSNLSPENSDPVLDETAKLTKFLDWAQVCEQEKTGKKISISVPGLDKGTTDSKVVNNTMNGFQQLAICLIASKLPGPVARDLLKTAGLMKEEKEE